MKKFLSFLCFLAVVACDKIVNVTNPAEPALAPVTVKVNDFSVSMDPMEETKVQDIDNEYDIVLGITLAFYDGAGNEVYKASQLKSEATEQNPFGVFLCNLPAGDLCMVVMGYGLPSAEDVFVYNGPTSAGYTSINGVRDTFCKVQNVTVNSTGPNNFTANLDRVTCKFILHSTDLKPANSPRIRITFGGGSNLVNPTTGLAVNNEGYFLEKSAGTDGYVSTSISFLYLFTEEQSLDVTVEALDDNGQTLATHTVHDVPFKRNYTTHLRGPIFTEESVEATASEFTINESWGITEYDINYLISSRYSDLSRVNPLSGAAMLRETANCYVVTEPGHYCIPLFYGNAIVDDSNNISTAAPAKVNDNDGVFVNAYDVAISSGNIKTDLENAGYSLNTSGAKLIWSTESASSNALVVVEPNIPVTNGTGYLCFSVPSERFKEGSALIGVLKDGSSDEYVWAWHIWITDGRVISTETYTNNQSVNIDILDRSLGGVSNNSLISTYYQFGMPFPLPPSNGSGNINATLYDENGTYTFDYDSGNTITTLGKALSKPYLPRLDDYGYFNDASGTAQNFYNMWDATQTADTDKIVVKTIYDPSPAGMCVPRKDAYTGFTYDGQNVSSSTSTGASGRCNVVGSFDGGWKFKKNSSDATGSLWANSGCRVSSSTQAFDVGSRGAFWSACSGSSTGAYSLYFYSIAVGPLDPRSRYLGFCVRPSLVQN